MTQTLAASPEAILNQVVTALRADDLDRAEAIFAGAPGVAPPQAFTRLAELNMRRRRWRDAAWLWDRAGEREGSAELKRCLCRNMASLERHRPDVYRQVVALPGESHVSVCASASGRPTIACRA